MRWFVVFLSFIFVSLLHVTSKSLNAIESLILSNIMLSTCECSNSKSCLDETIIQKKRRVIEKQQTFELWLVNCITSCKARWNQITRKIFCHIFASESRRSCSSYLSTTTISCSFCTNRSSITTCALNKTSKTWTISRRRINSFFESRRNTRRSCKLRSKIKSIVIKVARKSSNVRFAIWEWSSSSLLLIDETRASSRILSRWEYVCT